MNKINTLLVQLVQSVPSLLQKRIDKVSLLENELAEAVKINETEKTEQTQQDVDDINENLVDLTNDIVEQLEALIESEKTTKSEDPIVEEKNKKSGWGFVVGALIVGVITLGAVQFNKNK